MSGERDSVRLDNVETKEGIWEIDVILFPKSNCNLNRKLFSVGRELGGGVCLSVNDQLHQRGSLSHVVDSERSTARPEYGPAPTYRPPISRLDRGARTTSQWAPKTGFRSAISQLWI